MRTSTQEKPRLVCRVTRTWLSITGDDSHAANMVTRSRHVAACPACREFFAAADSLELALKRDSVREYQPTPDGLERMIMQAVTRAAREPVRAPRRSNLRFMFASMAGAAAAAVVAILVLRQPTTDKNDAHFIAELAQTAENLPNTIRAQIQPSAEKLAPKLGSENSLLQEVSSVRNDARSALAFLAANFLPSDFSMPGSVAEPAPAGDRG